MQDDRPIEIPRWFLLRMLHVFSHAVIQDRHRWCAYPEWFAAIEDRDAAMGELWGCTSPRAMAMVDAWASGSNRRSCRDWRRFRHGLEQAGIDITKVFSDA